MGSLKLISFLFLVLCVITWNIKAQAQDGEWGPRFNLNPDATPLEIVGGNVIPGWDTYIVLVEEAINGNDVDVSTKTIAPNTLGVYHVNEADPNIVTTSSIPIDSPAFGFAHEIVNVGQTGFFGGQGTSVTAIVDNFRLQFLTSNDGFNWQKGNISNNPFYGSAEVAFDPLNPNVVHAGGCNTVNNSYDIFESFDGGQTWTLVVNIFGEGGPITCAIDGGTRCTFDVYNGQHAVYCGQLVNNVLELFMNRGNGNEVFDTDIFPPSVGVFVREANRLKISENSSPLPRDRTIFNYTYFHNQSNTVKNVASVIRGLQQQQSPIIVQGLGAAPNAVFDFFGITMSEGPPGTANVIYPGRHIQLMPTNQILDFDPFQAPVVIDLTDAEFPLVDVQNGPVGTTGMEIPATSTLPPDFPDNTDFQDPREYRFTVGFRFSFDYAEFRGPLNIRNIPTLGEWGLIALAGVLMLSGAFYLRRRNAVR